MQDDTAVDRSLTADEAEQLMHRVMWRQARLSLAVAVVFIAILVLIPLFNLFAPEIAGTPILGFTLTWLLLGVLFYPITWALSSYFVKRSNQLEAEIAKEPKK
jgi:uncharacterized membrane protein (DUF485 family)